MPSKHLYEENHTLLCRQSERILKTLVHIYNGVYGLVHCTSSHCVLPLYGSFIKFYSALFQVLQFKLLIKYSFVTIQRI